MPHLAPAPWVGFCGTIRRSAANQPETAASSTPAIQGRRTMAIKDVQHVSEAESRKVAEASREAEWKQPSFLREMFLGNFRLDLIHPYPLAAEERPEFTAFYQAMREFLRDE